MPRGEGWIERLRSCLEQTVITQELERDVEGLRPSAVVRPGSVQDLASVLSFAGDQGLAVVPVGGGTALHMGNPPARVDIMLDMGGITEGFEHAPEDMVAILPAGMTIAAANELLRHHRQVLPLDPPMPERATVGGALAVSSFGPRRQSFGAPGDSVLGMKMVLPNGQVAKAGGRVVKNVAGYNMMKLYVGSLGTLGVIVEASLRLQPLPEFTMTLASAFPTFDGAVRTAGDVLDAGLESVALTVLSQTAASTLSLDPSGHYLLAEFGDLREVVERQVGEVKGMAEVRGAIGSLARDGDGSRELWQSVSSLPLSTWSTSLRASLPPATMDAFLNAVPETLESLDLKGSIIAHPGFGVAHVGLVQGGGAEVTQSAFEELGALSSSLGGHLILEKAPAEVKRGIDVWGPRPPHFDLIARMKAEFDPDSVLNPGRFIGGL
ncbi:MAG: FAD-binding oxidoreductase [Thermoplasmata archaeon]